MLQCDQRQSDLLRRNEAKERRNADNDALKFEMLKAWGTVLDPSRFSVCCHSPLVSSKQAQVDKLLATKKANEAASYKVTR